MPKATTRDVPHTCVACNSGFLGTPKATRCSTCRAAGIHQPSKCKPRKQRLPREAKTCAACGSEFEGSPKAQRCKPCSLAGERTHYSSCLECGTRIINVNGELTCHKCADIFGLTQFDVPPEIQAKLAADERLEKFKERRQVEIAWLKAREKKPKGKPKMSYRTTPTAIGQLWSKLCALDGAAASVLHSAPCTVNDGDKIALLRSFHTMRVQGYHPKAIAKLCPKELLKGAAQGALEHLSRPTPEQAVSEALSASDDESQTQAQAIALGLA